MGFLSESTSNTQSSRILASAVLLVGEAQRDLRVHSGHPVGPDEHVLESRREVSTDGQLYDRPRIRTYSSYTLTLRFVRTLPITSRCGCRQTVSVLPTRSTSAAFPSARGSKATS